MKQLSPRELLCPEHVLHAPSCSAAWKKTWPLPSKNLLTWISKQCNSHCTSLHLEWDRRCSVMSTLEGHATPDSSPVPNITPLPLRDIQTARKLLMSLEIILTPSQTHPKIHCKTRMCHHAHGQSTVSELLASISWETSIKLSLVKPSSCPRLR